MFIQRGIVVQILLNLVTGQMQHLDNLALYKPSGSYPKSVGMWPSRHAVDGDRRYFYKQLTCTGILIGDEGTAVFWVDLLAVYDIATVIISGELVFHANGNNFEVLATDALDVSNTDSLSYYIWKHNFTVCASQGSETIPPRRVKQYTCHENTRGRYVVILKSGPKKQFFTFCEIEVYSVNSYTNVALNKPSAMYTNFQGSAHTKGFKISAAGNDGQSVFRIAGIKNAVDFTCIHSSNAGSISEEYWAVDLGREHRIRRIMVVNVGDGYYNVGSYLKKFRFLITTDFHPWDLKKNEFIQCFHQMTPLAEVESVAAICNYNTIGRYVLLLKYNAESQGILICEMEVMATPVEDNLALNKMTYMSGEVGKRVKTSGKAVDGVLSTTFGAGSCIQTPGVDKIEWWVVDLVGLYKIRNVVIVNVGETGSCQKPLGMAYNRQLIKDSQITASSSFGKFKATCGRLWYPPVNNVYLSWCAGKQAVSEYLQIKLDKVMKITGFTVGSGYPNYITSVHVSYSLDGKTFVFVKDAKGNKQVFGAAPAAYFDVRTSWFTKPLLLKVIKIHAVTWQGWLCMKVELHGCDPKSGSTLENFKIQTMTTFDPHNYSKNKFTLCHSQKEEFPPAYIRPLYCKGRPLARYVSIEKTSVTTITPLKLCEFEVYGEPFDGNLAYGKPTSQNSTYWRYGAHLAVDGDRRYNFTRHASCSKTLSGHGPSNWWSVDLGERVDVGRVTVVSHLDCGCECLQSFEILVTDVFDPKKVDKTKYRSCYSHPKPMEHGEVRTLHCGPGSAGRFLVIVAPGDVPLTLCEVEVYHRNDLGDNLALGKPCSQSSDGDSTMGHCERAIDGMRLTNFYHGSCTLTGNKMQDLWWHVDLLAIYQIKKIVIVNREDALSERLKNFNVVITKIFIPYELSKIPSTLCYSQPAPLKPGEVKTIFCPNRPIGRHVTIVKRQGQIAEPLTLCELEVYGTPSEENIAMRKTTYSSSDLTEPTKQKAVDGFTSPNYFDGSCATTKSDSDRQWWSVDLGKVYTVDRVVITNRADCCAERLRNYRVVLSGNLNQKDVLSSAYHLCSDNRHSMGGDLIQAKCKHGAYGRFLTIVKDNTKGEPLTLCEVEVYGNVPKLELGPNYAQGKPTIDGDPYDTASDLATDGNMKTGSGTCFRTSGVEAREWWLVNLQQDTADISKLKIATGIQSDKKHLDLTVYLLDIFTPAILATLSLKTVSATSPAPTSNTTAKTAFTTAGIVSMTTAPITSAPTIKLGNSVRICGVFKGVVSGGEYLTLSCPAGSRGQYVLVVKQNSIGDPLILCEVGVYGPDNVKTTTMPPVTGNSTLTMLTSTGKARKKRAIDDSDGEVDKAQQTSDSRSSLTLLSGMSLYSAGAFLTVFFIMVSTISGRFRRNRSFQFAGT